MLVCASIIAQPIESQENKNFSSRTMQGNYAGFAQSVVAMRVRPESVQLPLTGRKTVMQHVAMYHPLEPCCVWSVLRRAGGGATKAIAFY